MCRSRRTLGVLLAGLVLFAPSPCHADSGVLAVSGSTQYVETRLDMGSAPNSAYSEGWSAPSHAKDRDETANAELATTRWALGGTAEVVIDLPAASAVSLRYRVRTHLPTQRIAVDWNGQRVGEDRLSNADGWIEIERDVSATLTQPGANTLRFASDATAPAAAAAAAEPAAFQADWITATSIDPSRRVDLLESARLGRQVMSDVLRSTLPGSLNFSIRVPNEPSSLTYGFGVSTVERRSVRVPIEAILRDRGGNELWREETSLDELGGRKRRLPSRVTASINQRDAGRLSDGTYGNSSVWRGTPGAPSTLEFAFDPPIQITGFAVSRDASAHSRDGIPAVFEVRGTRPDGSPIVERKIDHQKNPGRQWHLLGGEALSSIQITIAETYDGAAPTIDEIVFTDAPISPRDAAELTDWQWRDIDLAPFAGRDLVLTLSAGHPTCQPASQRCTGTAYFAAPRLIERTRKRWNLLLVSMDTVRADHLSALGYPRPTTPFLESLVARDDTVTFSNARSASTWTLPSHLSLLTGLTPSRHRVQIQFPEFLDWLGRQHRQRMLPANIDTLAEILRDRGYQTVALASAGPMLADSGLGDGFDLYDDTVNHLPNRPLDFHGELESKAALTTRWLERLRDRPFFLFLHSYVAHAPYKSRQFADCRTTHESSWCHRYEALLFPAANRLSRINIGDQISIGVFQIPTQRDLYDSGLRLMDSYVAHVFAEIQRLGLEDDTLVVVTSDHGEAFAEHLPGFYDAHGQSFYEEYLHVPMFFVVPGLGKAREIEAPVSSVDVVPTVLEALGIDARPPTSGTSLWPVLHGASAKPLSERTIFYEGLATEKHEDFHFIAASRGRYKILANPYDLYDGHHELYDLIDDSGEHVDISSRSPDIAKRLLNDLDRHLNESLGGLIVLELSVGDRPVEVSGTIDFDQPATIVARGRRKKAESTEHLEGGRHGYHFRFEMKHERRRLGFSPTRGLKRIGLTLDKPAECKLRVAGKVLPADRLESLSLAEIEVDQPTPWPRLDAISGCEGRIYYQIGTGPSDQRAPVENSLSAEQGEEVLEQLRLLGYAE